ncbi:hypothetical protein PS893_00244 [Pseudomonas fluorescens]|jgi:hypothetical protein|nr:hypothetical protein PS893_00244 [Pseudomonas fluorescens]
MRAGKVAAVAVAGMLVSGGAIAITGNELAAQCQAFIKDPTPPSQYFDSGVCAGYISGMVDGLSMVRAVSPEKVSICFPQQNFTTLQGVKVVQRFLDTHPERLNEGAGILTATAFRLAFPCQ